MARIQRVKSAQVRYPRVPILDGDGKPLRQPVTRRGQQVVTKKGGRPVTRAVTREDRDQPPLPNHKCMYDDREIKPGDPYKYIDIKTGPRSSKRLIRCAQCPDWHIWEYSQSLSAQLAEVEYDFNKALDSAREDDDVKNALQEAAETIRGIAEAKREAGENMEGGFEHSTSQSDALIEQADQLDDWASEVESATYTDFPDPEETECEECEGSGEEDCGACEGTGQVEFDEGAPQLDTCPECTEGKKSCQECSGTGQAEAEVTDEQIEDWLSDVRGDLSIVGEPPV